MFPWWFVIFNFLFIFFLKLQLLIPTLKDQIIQQGIWEGISLVLDTCIFPIRPPGVGFSIMWVTLVVNFLQSMGTSKLFFKWLHTALLFQRRLTWTAAFLFTVYILKMLISSSTMIFTLYFYLWRILWFGVLVLKATTESQGKYEHICVVA